MNEYGSFCSYQAAKELIDNILAQKLSAKETKELFGSLKVDLDDFKKSSEDDLNKFEDLFKNAQQALQKKLKG